MSLHEASERRCAAPLRRCCIHFDPKGKMSACTIKSYLLEQSRVVGVGEGTERCYHIYYHMLAGASADEPDALKPTVAWTYGLFRSCGTRSSHARFRPLYVTHACLPVLV